jgi:biopolymer transport protein ExbD
MAFASFDADDDAGDLAEINMIPLIDVMLVLLVIFIVTAPLLTHAVKIDLPKASSTPNLTRAENVQLAIDADGQVFWNGDAVDAAILRTQLKLAAAQSPQPELHLRAERSTPYEKVAEVMSAAAREGLAKIGFVTEPRKP